MADRSFIKVVKFGGSSLADAEHFKKAADIILSDPTRRYVVPSAPGKCAADNRKVIWVEVKEKCQKYWISQPFVNLSEDTVLQLYAELFD